ncbi:MAG: UbiA family prenyltransferase [Acidobacteriaceae bacterium]|nr:UbiA family prenyltransferase [Acidobacteriaceae bacterium]MBV9443315.1 UbiA family prenyltransferase [Acidobacteriaceae bacterium]
MPAALSRPLCVDLDQTLVRTDTLHEIVLGLLRSRRLPLSCLWWLCRGRAYFKKRMCALPGFDVTMLPYDEGLLAHLKAECEAGRPIYLTTGADERVANDVAAHLGVFMGVLASDGRTNLVGAAKRRAIQARFGNQGFDYVGNGVRDIPIWLAAHEAVVVNPSRLLLRRLRRSSIRLSIVCQKSGHPVQLLLRAIRIHQWSKNALIFVPYFLSHRLSQVSVREGVALLAFCFAASSVYVVNDLLDAPFDRKHAQKRFRPFASGDLSTSVGIVLTIALLVLSTLAALVQPISFRAWLASYWLTAFLYSYRLKKLLFLDAVTLAALYTVRVLAGGAVRPIVISPWTLGFSIFVFLSLASAKRVSELRRLDPQRAVVPGRAYTPVDEPMLCTLGAAAGYIGVMLLALYINSPDVQKLYSKPEWLWLICPCLLYWIGRFWLIAHRGEVDEDPVLFALKDKISFVVAFVIVVITIVAL